LYRDGVDGCKFTWRKLLFPQSMDVFGIVLVPDSKRYFYIRVGLSRREASGTVLCRAISQKRADLGR